MTKRIIQRINTILKHITTVKNDLKGISLEGFKKSDILVRATAFSISQIGEQMGKIEEQLKENYNNLPWRAAKDMRNIIVHVYNRVKAEIVYDTATKDLADLENSLLKIKEDLEKQL